MKKHLSDGLYFGRRNAAQEAGSLLLTESSYAPLSEIPKHAHENAYFVYTLQGSQEEVFGNRNRTYVPGTLAFHPAGETHCEKLGPDGMRCLHVEFGAKWLGRHEAISRVLGDGSHFQDGRLGWLARRVYREFRNMDDVAPVAIEGLVLELLADASRLKHMVAAGKSPRWLAQARELIEARFSEPLSVTEIAAAVEIHPVHLCRQFLKRYHRTVADHIRQLRVESACRKISTSSDSLADIAVAAGFSDQAHFTRTCKRVTGRTPAEFRRAAGKR